FEPEKAEHGEHQNADAGAEVAAVDRDQKLREDGDAETASGDLRDGRRRAGSDPAACEPALDEEEEGREQDQERGETSEQPFRRQEEERRAEGAAEKARQEEGLEPMRVAPHLLAIAGHAARGPGEEREGRGGVRGDRRQADEDEGGEGE